MTSPPAPLATNRRPSGQVRQRLIEAGLELARGAGPNAVRLREATRRVGVVPNAAYRHFKDRDALLNAVCVAAMRQLARRMEDEVARVSGVADSDERATARLTALGRAYLDFAFAEPGLFETAFAVPRHLEFATDGDAAGAGGRTPFQLLGDALDELVGVGVLPRERRPAAEYAVWASVHGMAVLMNQGPLRRMPAADRGTLVDNLLSFIARGL
jgi:AcrR family transcriptional regulator